MYSGLDFLAYHTTIQKLENEKEELIKENNELKKKLATLISWKGLDSKKQNVAFERKPGMNK